MALAATGHPSAYSRFDHGNENEAFVHVFPEFPEMLMSKLNAQRRTSSLCDVTIVTKDGRSYRAHKAVLAACSHYLEGQLTALSQEQVDRKSEAVIHLGMISSKSFETLLDLLYTSKLMLTNENVTQVLSAAETLDLEQVSRICRQFLRSHITSKSVACGLQYHHDSHNVSHDENNNNVIRESECCKTGQSQESNASSSGVSSLGPDNCEKGKSAISSRKIEFTERVMKYIPERPVSLSDMTTCDAIPTNVERSSSAPHRILGKEEGESCEESPSSIQDRDLQSPTEHIDVTSTEWCSNAPATSSGTSNRESTLDNNPSNLHAKYKVKSEVQIMPDYYTTTKFQDSNFSENTCEKSDFQVKNGSNFRENSEFYDRVTQNFQRTHSHLETTSSVDYHNMPLGHRRSYDSALSNQRSFVDLNSTPVAIRKKAKSVDQPPAKMPYLSAVPSAFQSQDTLQSPSSFWASLYMLRSHALTSAGFLGANAKDSQQVYPYPAAVNFPGRQLQYSKSVATATGLLCKLCRLEFASDLALSMHQHLCHPMSYFYQSQTTSPQNQLRQEPNQDEETATADLRMRQLPLSKSMSTPERSGARRIQSESDIGREFGNKMIGIINGNDNKTMHKCYHCKKEFDSIFLLRKHKSIEHMKRPYRCHRCDSAFPNKAGLSVHLRSHTGERPYRCKVCSKTFTQLGHVQRHQKVHTGEKPYQCPLCQARVRDKASMHYHILAHRGIKPFQCDQCDARFTKRSSLVKHKNVHTGSFLYQCPQCKASFREKASLSRHVRSQHKDPCFTVTSEHASTRSLDYPSENPTTPLNLHVSSSVDEIQVS